MAIFPCEDVRIQASSVLRAWLLLLWEKEWQKGLQGAAWPDLVRAELWSLLSLLHGYARVGGEHTESSEQLCGEKSLGQMLTQEASAVTVRGSEE